MSWVIDANQDAALQDWGEAYKDLCALLRTKVPELKHIDLYYGQEQMIDADGNWLPFKSPAVFIQFQAAAVNDLGDLAQELMMDITFYLYVETVQDTNDTSAGQERALQFIGLMRKLHQALHNASGDHYSPLSRVGLNKVDAPPYVQMYGQVYRCVMIDNSASRQWPMPDAGVGLPLEVDPFPVGGPTSELVLVRNSDDSYHVELAFGTVLHVLPDVTHTDSDGSPRVLPGMTPMVCTPAGGGECAPATAQLRDTLGNLIGAAEQIPSGGAAALTAPNASYSINGTTAGQILSNGTADIAVRDEDGEPRGIYEELLEAHIIGDTKVQRRDSASAAIGSALFFRPETANNVLCPDGTVTGRNSFGTSLGSVAVQSNGVADIIIPDSTITRPDGTAVGLPASVALDVRTYRSGIAYQFGHALWSDQSTSYRTGDEGWLWQQGWYDYDAPLYPTHYARLGSNRLTLRDINIHGNTSRFTDRYGGQTYALGIVQDHLYGIEIPITLYSAVDWNSAIDAPLALTLGGDSDWVCMPPGVLYAIANMQTGSTAGAMNFAPFSIANTNFWSSSRSWKRTSSPFHTLPM